MQVAALPLAKRDAALLADRVLEVGALRLAGLGLERPAIADGVAQLERVDGLGEADAITDVKLVREVAAEHQRRVVAAGPFRCPRPRCRPCCRTAARRSRRPAPAGRCAAHWCRCAVDCTLASDPPARISVAICCCGMEGSEKNVMRCERSVPRTLTPAMMSGNSFCARRSMPGSLMGPLLKISRPRSISRRRPSATNLPSTILSSPWPRVICPSSERTVMLPPSRAVRPKASMLTWSPSTSLRLLATIQRLRRVHRRRADQHLVTRSQHGIGQVRRRQPRIGNQHLAAWPRCGDRRA